jgi:hypothetical protein
MMFAGFRAILVASFVTFAISVSAATITVVNDGSDGATAKIRIYSEIRKGDLAAFDAAIDQVSETSRTRINDVPFITVELSSPGGDVVEALDIGRSIYQHAAMTLIMPGEDCVSACVFMFVAGAVHTPTDSSRIGVHRPLLVSWSHIGYREAHARYDGLMRYLREYFAQFGISAAAYDIMMSTDSRRMRYFSQAELDRFGFQGETPQWDARYAARLARSEPVEYVAATRTAPEKILPKVPEIYRDLVIMPGSAEEIEALPAVAAKPLAQFSWSFLDDEAQRYNWVTLDVVGYVKVLFRMLAARLGPASLPIALFFVELLRGQFLPSFRHSSQDSRRDQWRLLPFALGPNQARLNFPAGIMEPMRLEPQRPSMTVFPP